MLGIQPFHPTKRTIKLKNDIRNLNFDAGKSIRYHSHLRSYWQRLDHLNKVFTIFFGTSTAVSAFGSYQRLMLVTSLLTAAFGSLDLVMGFSDKIKIYDDLYKK
ncbi:MAG: hypothetical protein ABF586_13685, partial [Sporolactobacillus sp.]